MLIGINNIYQIKQIRDINDTSLTVIELDETDQLYPFKGWSDAKILCYCYKQTDNVVSIYPYIPTNIVEKIEADNMKILQQEVAGTNAMVLEFMETILLGGM